ncbi:MAG: tRNA (adenosine(37)-N6)-dimethylallyltransferase MiaA [Candidatus Paceibacteria bacterium]
MTKQPLIIIVGPTASGKTSLSIKLAEAFAGEVISADSRQVYRGLDLGSGKVTTDEMRGIPHHLLDIADPMTVYNASDFVRDAKSAIADIAARQHLPIIAGGTFFYIDSLLGRLSLPSVPPNDTLRTELEYLSVDELYARLTALDPVRSETVDKNNPRRLVRAIEIATALGHVPPTTISDSPYRPLTLGITIDKETLHHNIHVRLHERLDAGMIAEVEGLVATGISHERLESLGLEYRYVSRYLRGLIDYDTMVLELETKIRQFAKRQYTWLKRDTSIIWIDPKDTEGINPLMTDFLAAPIPAN